VTIVTGNHITTGRHAAAFGVPGPDAWRAGGSGVISSPRPQAFCRIPGQIRRRTHTFACVFAMQTAID